MNPEPEKSRKVLRPVQYFDPEYLQRCKAMSKEQIVAFLEEFALLQQARKVEDQS